MATPVHRTQPMEHGFGLRATGDEPTAANTSIPDPNILQALRRSVKIMQSHLVSLQV
ncbi:MAG: hypothetical protein ACYCY0_09635 [Acidithiobacillus ferrivorans]